MLRWENSSLISIFMACLKGLGGLHGVDCICTLLDYRQELSDLAVKTSCKKGSNNIDYVLIHLIFLFQHGNTHRSRNWGKVFSCILNTSCLTSFLSMDCEVILKNNCSVGDELKFIWFDSRLIVICSMWHFVWVSFINSNQKLIEFSSFAEQIYIPFIGI